MRLNKYLGAAALAAGLAFVGLAVPVGAAPVGPAVGVTANTDSASQVEQVGRRWHRHHRYRYWGHRRHRYYGYGYRPYYYGYGPGIYLNFGVGPRWHRHRHWRRW